MIALTKRGIFIVQPYHYQQHTFDIIFRKVLSGTLAIIIIIIISTNI